MLKLSKQILIQKEAQIAFQWQREKSKLGLPSFPKVLEKSPFSSPLKGNLQLPSFSLRGTWAHIFQRSNQTIKLEGLWNNCVLFFPSKVVSLLQRQVNVNWVRATLQGACWFESQVEVLTRVSSLWMSSTLLSGILYAPALVSIVVAISVIYLMISSSQSKRQNFFLVLWLRMLSWIMGDFDCNLRRALHYTKCNSFSDRSRCI